MAAHVVVLAIVLSLPERPSSHRAPPRPRVDIVFYPVPAPVEPLVVPTPVPEPVIKSEAEPPAPTKRPERPGPMRSPETVAKPVVEPSVPERKPTPPPALPETPSEPEAPEPLPTTREVRTSVFAAADPAESRRQATDREIRSNVFGATEPDRNDAPDVERRAVTGIFTAERGEGDLVVSSAPPRDTRVGAFATTASERSGEGTSPDRPRVVASSGFGASARPGDRSSPAATRPGSVKRGGFGDIVAVAPPSSPRELPGPDPDIPVEIVSKPRPTYTAEARRLGVEGEVVLEVTFSASGNLSIHRIVEGLGHGLDEAAVDAARRIHFKPARRGGRPVDYPATLRVVFQLA